MPLPPPERLDFVKLEYRAMMTKMSELRADVSRTETVYALAMAAIYAWVFTHNAGGSGLWTAALLLPPVIGALGLLRIRARQRTMEVLENYICDLEREFYGDDAPLGWEHIYAEKRPMRIFAIARYWVGGAILIVSLLLAVCALYDPPRFAPPPAGPSAAIPGAPAGR